MLLDLKQNEFVFKYPLIVPVNFNDYLYFFTNFYVAAYKEEKIMEAIYWVKTIEFELENKYKDTHLKIQNLLLKQITLIKYMKRLREMKEILESLFRICKTLKMMLFLTSFFSK